MPELNTTNAGRRNRSIAGRKLDIARRLIRDELESQARRLEGGRARLALAQDAGDEGDAQRLKVYVATKEGRVMALTEALRLMAPAHLKAALRAAEGR